MIALYYNAIQFVKNPELNREPVDSTYANDVEEGGTHRPHKKVSTC